MNPCGEIIISADMAPAGQWCVEVYRENVFAFEAYTASLADAKDIAAGVKKLCPGMIWDVYRRVRF